MQCGGMGEKKKKSTLRWFGHIERMGNEEFVKKVYRSSVGGTNRRGRPLGRWEDRVGRATDVEELSGRAGVFGKTGKGLGNKGTAEKS